MNMIFALYPRKVPPPIGFGALGLREQGASPKPPKTPKTPKTQLNKTNIKNGSKWVLSGHTTSPCNNLDEAKFLTHSKMVLNGYFLGTQSHHAALRKLNFAEKKNVISLQHRRQYLCQMQPIALS